MAPHRQLCIKGWPMKRALWVLTVITALVVLLLSGTTFFQAGSGVSYCPRAEDLQDALQQLDDAIHGRHPMTPELLKQIHGALSGVRFQNHVNSSTETRPKNQFNSQNRSRVVCPERYAGPAHESRSKWVTEECDYALPVSELVTVILLSTQNRSQEDQMMATVQRRLPNVPVIVPLDADDPKPDSGAVRYVMAPPNATSGELWNALISACVTPYAFLATDVLNITLDLGSLQRLVRVLTETEGTQVVGGAIRNATGYWRAGCYQVALKNYVLRYRKGYHESLWECMRCDHVDGPFLAATSLLQGAPMDRKLPAAMLLPDFFLRVFRHQSSLLCPDVMVSADALLASPAARDRGAWQSLAARWQLNRIQIRFHRATILHKFNCSEAGLRCITNHGTTALPVCCQEEFARVVGFWARFAADHRINYQFNSGSALGAIKMEDLMPWDIDGDIFFDKANYSFVKSSAEEFRRAGVLLVEVKGPTAGSSPLSWGLMQLIFSSFFVELYAVPLRMENRTEQIFPDEDAAPGANPFNATRVEIHGVWVTAPPNPGLYARGRYGKDILKHALGWRHNGKKSSWEPYDSAGQFSNSCEKAGHHACLSAMPADGSIFYDVPE